MRPLEPGMRMADCASCQLRLGCETSSILAEAVGAFMAVLDRTTLEVAAQSARPAFSAWISGPPAGAARPG